MKKGFTIIELVIVISVLVILIGIAIPRMKGMQDSTKIAKAKAELQTIQAAVESYYTFNNNQYPLDIGTSLINTNPQIISSIPTDPFYNPNVEPSIGAGGGGYLYSTSGSYYVIVSEGPSLSNTLSAVNIVNTGWCYGQADIAPLNYYPGVICKTNSLAGGCSSCTQG